MTTAPLSTIDRAREVAATVTDPEMPMLTLADLGVLRDVYDHGGTVVVTITPTYSGCPAMATMRDDLRHRLGANGFGDVDIRTVLQPAWSSDWISPAGRRKLAEHGISPPSHDATRPAGPVALTLSPPRPLLDCPQCGSANTELTSEFGSTSCKSLHRCLDCAEPFDHVKEI
ncbi:MAG: phenylacetate-CoA oxygenase subunit PaaJ [Actinomycetota bacterium]|nr:phenylacetate-CoA oxygenase subunit PaaJ [Actinomycetota bacterium]